MPDKLFLTLLSQIEVPDNAVLDISNGEKVLVISDLHMGCGSRDDLYYNGDMLTCILEEYYYKNGWILILNGDIEELHGYPLDNIRERWAGLFRVFNLFSAQNRLFKIIGNHDDQLLHMKHYPYTLHNVIRIETGIVPAYVFHGHQLSVVYSNFNKLLGFGVRYFLRPFGIKNITGVRNPHKRFTIEKKAYDFSLKNHCLSVIGHTHRPLFESLGRFDYMKFEIERLCRDYPVAQSEDRIRIENEVTTLKKELGKLKRKERQDAIRQSLYGDDLPVPCLFNSGSAISKKGLDAIEISNKDIALVYWFEEGKSKKFVTRGGYDIEEIQGRPYRKAVLNHNKLDYIFAKIKLLGNQ